MKRAVGILIVFVMFFSCSYATKKNLTEKNLWLNAWEEDTIQACQEYLAEYPNGKFADQVKNRLGYLIEEQEYTQAKKINKVESFRTFLEKYPDGHFSRRAHNEIEYIAWCEAKMTNELEVVDYYLMNYPEGSYSKQAARKREQVIEDIWEKTRDLDTIQAYQDYLQKYPEGKYADNAKIRINRLIDSEAWTKAKDLNTIECYDIYLKKFPNGWYKYEAARNKALIFDERAWQKAKRINKFKGYADYLSSFPKGKYAEEARKAIPKFYLLTDAQIAQIGKWQRAKNPKAKHLDNVEKLLFNGANCLDSNANWENRTRGRQIYNILKGYDSKLLTEAMTHVVLMEINRLHILFLVVKLGILGTQKRLNALLLKFGDKSMAEDYLNSGSEELRDGGRNWAREHGYSISTGWGSHRVNWGSF